MGAIDTGDLARFVVARFKKGNRVIDEETAAELVRYADSVTGDVQQLCEAIWDTTDSFISMVASTSSPIRSSGSGFGARCSVP